MSLYFNCEKCLSHIKFGEESKHDCEYGTKERRKINELESENEKLKTRLDDAEKAIELITAFNKGGEALFSAREYRKRWGLE